MRITRWGEYGILCCLHLAKMGAVGASQSTPVGASEIAEQQQIPLQYAQQILHRLRKGGVIKSVRGPHGGFLLTRAPEATTLREVLLAAEGHTFELICESDPIHQDSCGPENECGLRVVWQELQGAINSLLEGRTLASVLASHPMVLQKKINKGSATLVSGPHRRPDYQAGSESRGSESRGTDSRSTESRSTERNTASEKPRLLSLVPPRPTESSTSSD